MTTVSRDSDMAQKIKKIIIIMNSCVLSLMFSEYKLALATLKIISVKDSELLFHETGNLF